MSFPVLDVFLSIMWFFLWVLWLYLVFWVIWDIFRSSDLGGWAKTGWVALTVLVPLFGVLAYLIVRGSTTYERQRSADRHPWNQSRETGEPNGMDSTPAGQISHLADLRDRHVISQEEFLRAKEHVLR
jgi:hypothetical protein